MSRIYSIFMMSLALFLFSVSINGKGKRIGEASFLETRVDRNHAVEGERLIYEVVLYSKDPAIAGAEIIYNPEFTGLDIARSAADNHLSECEKNGTLYYCAVIDRFFIGTGRSGEFTVKGGKYRIGYNRDVAVDDPFWGHTLANRIEVVELEAPDLRFSVSKLPEKDMPVDFSGAVGEFSIDVSLHSSAFAGEKSCLLVTISGRGDLSCAKVPDIPLSFPKGLKFKSMTEARSHYIHHGSLGSEVEMECEFIADSPGKYILAPISFCYFDSTKGKYVTIHSDPLEIEVDNPVKERDDPPVIMDI